MLQNEPQEEVQNAPALPPGRHRVTPEELTSALEALESRRQEQARQVQQTVAIGDVVQELGLDVTPEEVWQQVQAQRAQHPAPPPPAAETKLADTVNETLHAAAQQAHKIAGQAAAAAATYVTATVAQAHASAVRRPRRGRRGVAAAIAIVVLAAVGISSAGHGLVISGDGQTATYSGNQKSAIISGDNETITLRGDCSNLVVSGDHDRITILGSVGRVVASGDGDAVTWTRELNGQSPAVIDSGDGNHVGPASP